MFTDQCATEGGRTQLGWLLTGLPDLLGGHLCGEGKAFARSPLLTSCRANWLNVASKNSPQASLQSAPPALAQWERGFPPRDGMDLNADVGNQRGPKGSGDLGV